MGGPALGNVDASDMDSTLTDLTIAPVRGRVRERVANTSNVY